MRPATVFPEEGRRLWTAAACCRFCTRSLLRDFGIEHHDWRVRRRSASRRNGLDELLTQRAEANLECCGSIQLWLAAELLFRC